MFFLMCFVAKSTAGEEPPDGVAWLSHGKFWQVCCNEGFQCTKYASWRVNEMGMDQYLLIPFLGGWTSINPSYFDVHQAYKVLTHPQICGKSAGTGWTLDGEAMRSWWIHRIFPWNLLKIGKSQLSMSMAMAGDFLPWFSHLNDHKNIWLVVWCFFFFFNPWYMGIIIPTDEVHHFSRGLKRTTNQLYPLVI